MRFPMRRCAERIEQSGKVAIRQVARVANRRHPRAICRCRHQGTYGTESLWPKTFARAGLDVPARYGVAQRPDAEHLCFMVVDALLEYPTHSDRAAPAADPNRSTD